MQSVVDILSQIIQSSTKFNLGRHDYDEYTNPKSNIMLLQLTSNCQIYAQIVSDFHYYICTNHILVIRHITWYKTSDSTGISVMPIHESILTDSTCSVRIWNNKKKITNVVSTVVKSLTIEKGRTFIDFTSLISLNFLCLLHYYYLKIVIYLWSESDQFRYIYVMCKISFISNLFN